jgi:hypothetical protein
VKADHRTDRCWLKGSKGDALHAVLCAASSVVRWAGPAGPVRLNAALTRNVQVPDAAIVSTLSTQIELEPPRGHRGAQVAEGRVFHVPACGARGLARVREAEGLRAL